MLITTARHRLATLVLSGLLVTACASVPLDAPKQSSYAIADTSGTREAKKAAEWMHGHSEEDGFYPLSDGFDAFGARLRLMSVAEVSIDAQYFLMKPDNAGLVFADKLLEAADRGVRVRLLLDDVFTSVDNVDLAMLNDHSNIEVRIFNPIARGGIYALNYAWHFNRANRRMHNKSFTVDNQVAIVGGRNIADEYFQLESSRVFIDFDTLCVGPIVKQVSKEFDSYWNHPLAVPMTVLYSQGDPEKFAHARAAIEQKMADAGDSIYAETINTPLMKQLATQELAPYIANARLLTDSPDKLLEPVNTEQQIVAGELREIFLAAETEIIVFTPYLIPGKKGMRLIKELRAKNIRIVILTNSLTTDNHTSAFAAYQRYRQGLLKSGVELWEARGDAAKTATSGGKAKPEHWTFHAKGMVIDRKRVFAGSLNLDPRSIGINSEMGLLIDSSAMARLLADTAAQHIPDIAYRLQLDENDRISWHATIDSKQVVETTEPQTSFWQRFQAWFLSITPEDQL